MNLKEVATILNAEVVCGHTKLEREVHAVFASDLMSDVLTIDSEKLLHALKIPRYCVLE